jgi:enediyne polyketide synthase
MTTAIALVGMACRYPDARSPAELWENVLSKRRAFRRLPPERLRLDDYFSPDRGAPDHTYATQAALVENYQFDRGRFRVSGSAYRSADPTHWLALDVAAEALADAGFPDGRGLPAATTGVILGNTLTSEFARANLLRLRWPYVRRVVESALREEGYSPERRAALLGRLEETYKAPFPVPQEETLAGGLSNTIAGRVCNHFHLHGGGYTVDAACAASLLAVATACSALTVGDLDVALAGGIDLSLDPFELVGFARVGALAAGEMRVYDARSDGFSPGEGCGFVVLMRHDEALARGGPIYALIPGWGVSSDGGGGITRPEVEGQLAALRRAYRRAGFGIDTVTYFEGHGTGTNVGDTTELQALTRARREASAGAPAAVIGSVKGNIGHTKAAAGVAGLIKAALAVHTQLLPPATGLGNPHPLLKEEHAALRVADEGEPWPADRPLRAGVSAMGFGGINVHVVLEGAAAERRAGASAAERTLLRSPQDAELFVLSAPTAADLLRQLEPLRQCAPGLTRAQLADLAGHCCRQLGAHRLRAAFVASNPAELVARLGQLREVLAGGGVRHLDAAAGLFLGVVGPAPRVGFLFPGQGAPVPSGAGALGRRFDPVHALYARSPVLAEEGRLSTATVQPALVLASLAGLRALDLLGIEAAIAVGHSLGELTALHWAGAFDEGRLLQTAVARGRAMADAGGAHGIMAAVAAGRAEVETLLNGAPVVLACLNSSRQTIISGERGPVNAVVARARARGLTAEVLPVTGAFHSPLMTPAVPALEAHLAREAIHPLRRRVISTVTGRELPPGADVRALLVRQLTNPVRFDEALAAAGEVDLWIEVGPGRMLSGLAEAAGTSPRPPCLSLDAGGQSLQGLLHATGAAFALGAPVAVAALFADRFTRPLDPAVRPRFFESPCERAPLPDTGQEDPPAVRREETGEPRELAGAETEPGRAPDPCVTARAVRELVARRAELPAAAVRDEDRLLADLHLNSIVVGQLVAEAARLLGLRPPAAPTEFASATVGEIARALCDLARTTGPAAAPAEDGMPAGVDSWVRPFVVELVEECRPAPRPPEPGGSWQVFGAADDPLPAPLRQGLAGIGPGGAVVCLPPEPDERHLGLLLDGARAVLGGRGHRSFVLVQHGGGGGAFARTLHLEAMAVTTCVVDVPSDCPGAVEWVVAEVQSATGYVEAVYDGRGRRRVPVLRPASPDAAGSPPALGPDDVLLVTGGGKGIAAECALALARESGCRLALLGRSRPKADSELTANLERMALAGARLLYLPADVTDAAAVGAAVRAARRKLGPITAVIHGAGTNVPRLLASADEAVFRRTLAPKVSGLRHVLGALDTAGLRLLVTFGSIIARTGMRGEADYAVANEWLALLTERFQEAHPACRCLTAEWSVWSGVGMGERLGRVEALLRAGTTPISPEKGVTVLSHLLGERFSRPALVVAGRVGELPTLRVERPALPFRRFLERPLVYYPRVELVVEADLSADADPYLNDHVFAGEVLFPAAVGLEAMAQVASALAGRDGPLVMTDVRFERPVVVPRGEGLKVRIAALARESGAIEVALRSEETGFQANHFTATARPGERAGAPAQDEAAVPPPRADEDRLDLDPSRDLYGEFLFQGPRFRRLRGYWRLHARECVAELAAAEGDDWFGRYLPPDLVLGDPGRRDAAMHAIQACIPHARLLPVRLERLAAGAADQRGSCRVWARERRHEGEIYVYDVVMTGEDGRVCERWDGLHLRRVGDLTFAGGWPAPLLGPYVERRVAELTSGARVAVVVSRSEGPCRAASDRAFARLVGSGAPVRRRPDGKPLVARPGAPAISAAHAQGLTLAVTGAGCTACDVERVVDRPAALWRDLLGDERLAAARAIDRERAEGLAAAGTRVWVALECLKKAGAAAAPLTISAVTADGWVTFAAGALRVATLLTRARGAPEPVVLGVLPGGDL